MTIKLEDIVNAQQAVERLSMERVPFKLAYCVAKLLKIMREEASLYFQHRNALIVELGAQVQQTPEEVAAIGKQFKVKDEHRDEFAKRVLEMNALPVVVEDRWLLVRTLLEDLSMSSADVLALEPLMIEENVH